MVYKKTVVKLKHQRRAQENAERKAKAAAPKPKKAVSVSKQLRDTQRLLSKDNLDYRLKKSLNKRLEELLQKRDEHKRAEKERKYATKYHMAKFFERQKLQRLLGKAKHRAGESQEQPSESDLAAVKQLQEDLQYVLHFPKGEKFVSLLKQADSPEAQAVLDQERARLRALVKQQLADEALVADADEGKSKGFQVTGGKASNTESKPDIQQGQNPKLQQNPLRDLQPAAKRQKLAKSSHMSQLHDNNDSAPISQKSKSLPVLSKLPADSDAELQSDVTSEQSEADSDDSPSAGGSREGLQKKLAGTPQGMLQEPPLDGLNDRRQNGASGLAADDDFFLDSEAEEPLEIKTEINTARPVGVQGKKRDMQQQRASNQVQAIDVQKRKLHNSPHPHVRLKGNDSKPASKQPFRSGKLPERSKRPGQNSHLQSRERPLREPPKPSKAVEETKPQRTRAEGGRKRRKKK